MSKRTPTHNSVNGQKYRAISAWHYKFDASNGLHQQLEKKICQKVNL